MSESPVVLRSVDDAIQDHLELLFRRDQEAQLAQQRGEEADRQACNNMRRYLVNRLAATEKIQMAAGQWEVKLASNKDPITQDLMWSAVYRVRNEGYVSVICSTAQVQNTYYPLVWFGVCHEVGYMPLECKSFVAAATFAAVCRQ